MGGSHSQCHQWLIYFYRHTSLNHWFIYLLFKYVNTLSYIHYNFLTLFIHEIMFPFFFNMVQYSPPKIGSPFLISKWNHFLSHWNIFSTGASIIKSFTKPTVSETVQSRSLQLSKPPSIKISKFQLFCSDDLWIY